MQLEIAKEYYTMEGYLVEVISETPQGDYPMQCLVHYPYGVYSECYTKDGKYNLNDKSPEDIDFEA